MEFIPLVVLGALVYKFTDFLKYLRAGDWNAVATQAIVWTAGIAAVALFAHSAFAGDIPVFGDITLATTAFAEQAIIGLSASSLFSAAYDAKKALDSTDSAKTPSLFE
jgi:hypothetical protein